MDPNIIVMIVAGAGILTMTLLLYLVLAPRMNARAKVKRRISMVANVSGEGVPSERDGQRGGRKRDIATRLKDAEKARAKKQSFATKYKQNLRMAGLVVSLQQYFLVCASIALASGIIYVVLALAFGMKTIAAPFVAVTLGFGVPHFVVKWLGRRRVSKFTLLFADAVDVIDRGVRSGLPVSETLNIIARESPEPVAGVFAEVVEAQRLGLNMEQSLERAQENMPTPEIRFFSIVLGIQQQTGGNLAETLANLSSVLRARKKMRDKVVAMSSEARTSAMIIGSLPFIVTALLCLVNFKYINLLFTDDLGQIMIMGALIWMATGVVVMRQMINFEI